MTPDACRALYARMFQRGEAVMIRRYTGAGTNRPRMDYQSRGVVMNFGPEELVGSIVQGDRKVVVEAQPLIDAQFPLPIVKGDKIVVRGRELNVEAADDNTRRVEGVLMGVELVVRG